MTLVRRYSRRSRHGAMNQSDICNRVVSCPYCGGFARLVDSSDVYRSGRNYGKLWACMPCGAWVGVHKNSRTFAPLGRLANAELRKAKIEAHSAFDRLWKEWDLDRDEAYSWLADRLGIEARECHIGMFDLEMCRRVIEIMTGRQQGMENTHEAV